MSDPPRFFMLRRRITLAQMQRLKDWHAVPRDGGRAEKAVWDAVVMVWLMGWIGCIPAFAFDAPWAFPLCLLGILAPQLYVDLRSRIHRRQRLRCDWLDLLN
jgi:hypothetical protein